MNDWRGGARHCWNASRCVVEIGCIHTCGSYDDFGRKGCDGRKPAIMGWKESCMVERVTKASVVCGRESCGFIAFRGGGSAHAWKCDEYVDVLSNVCICGIHSRISRWRCGCAAATPSLHGAESGFDDAMLLVFCRGAALRPCADRRERGAVRNGGAKNPVDDTDRLETNGSCVCVPPGLLLCGETTTSQTETQGRQSPISYLCLLPLGGPSYRG